MINKLSSIDPSFKCLHNIEGISVLESISTPQFPAENTFVFVKNKKFLAVLLNQKAVKNLGVLFSCSFYEEISSEDLNTLKEMNYWIATTDNFEKSMCQLSKYFYDKKRSGYNFLLDGRIDGSAKVSPKSKIAQNVFIGENVTIDEDVELMPGAVIHANSKISSGTIIHSNVTIYPDTVIGSNCCIHSGTIIGADGFGYNFVGGKHEKIWHFGAVIIGDNVDIGANSCVDQGTFSPTTIGSGTKIDNFCQIAHNCIIGENCIMCGYSACAGSVVVEDFVVFGANAGAGPSAHIGKGAKLAAKCAVNENAIIEAGKIVAGHPAIELKKWLRIQAKTRNL